MTHPATEAGQEAPRGSALRDLADDPSSRKRFFTMMGGAGAASAFAIFLAACGDDEDEASSGGSAQTETERMGGGGGDLAIVQYALTLEHLETDFYNAVIDAGVIRDRALAETAMRIRDHEQEHVDALTATVEDLGGTPEQLAEYLDTLLDKVESTRFPSLQMLRRIQRITTALPR